MGSTRTRESLVVCMILIAFCSAELAYPFSSGVYQVSLPSSGSISPFNSAGVVGVNIPVAGETTPDRQQVETTIAADPRNPNILVGGGQDLRLKSGGEHRWHGFYRSTDGGQTWTNSLLPGFPGDTSQQGLSSPLHGSNATSDPVLAFDRFGDVYYAGLVFNVSAAGQFGNGPIGNIVAFIARYVNDGATYSGASLITSVFSADKEWIAVDNTGGPHDGNLYVAVDGAQTPTSIFASLFTRSTDGGKTFSVPFYVPADQTGELAGVAVDSSGNVYVSTDAFDPITGANLNYIQVSKITNGGTTLVQNVRAVNPASWVENGTALGATFRAFTIPQIAADANGVYLIFDDMRLGNSNVYLTRSTDGGTTWTSPLRVNDVLTGQHFFPTIAVSGGIVDVAWYDSRLNTGSTITALDVYFVNSFDNGVSFSSSVRVTSVSFNPGLALRTDSPNPTEPFMGDYFEIAATPSTAYPLWADNRFACDTVDSNYGSCVDQDAFTATISLPDFRVTVSPALQAVSQGTSGIATISLNSLNLFQGSVTVSAASTPAGLPVSPTSMTVPLSSGGTASFNFTFSPTLATMPTTYSVSIVSTSGPRTHSTATSVTVQAPSVGGSLAGLDRLSVIFGLIATLEPAIIAVTAGTWAISERKRRARRSIFSANEGNVEKS